MKPEERRQIELRLFESDAGYELLDVIAQANLNLDEIAAEEFDSMRSFHSKFRPLAGSIPRDKVPKLSPA